MSCLFPFQVTWLPVGLSDWRQAVLICDERLETCVRDAGR